jgi:hypothetical protein
MTDAEFEVVADDLRSVARQLRQAAWVQTVLDGKTIRVNSPQAKLGGSYRTFAKQGYKLHTRADGEGSTIVWAEKIAELTPTVSPKGK